MFTCVILYALFLISSLGKDFECLSYTGSIFVGCLRQMIVLQMWALEQVWLCSVNILSWYSISKFQNRILSPGVTLNIHLSILASFFSTLIKWSSFSSQISISCSIKFHTKASNTLPVEARGKPLLANKGNKFLNIFNPFFNLANSLSAVAFLPQNLLYLFFNLANSLPAVVNLPLLYHYDNKTSPKFKRLIISFYAWTCLPDMFSFSCLTKLDICLPHVPLVTSTKCLVDSIFVQNWKRVRLLPTPFLQIVKGDFKKNLNKLLN